MTYNTSIKITGVGSPTLVFIHYFGGSAESWRWVMNILSRKYRCVAISLPGFGHNSLHHCPGVEYYAGYVLKELKRLRVDRFVLVGHSMGGKIALQMALHEKDKNTVQQLILLAPSPPTVERMPEPEKERMLHHPDEKTEKETVIKITVNPLPEERFNLAVETQDIIDHYAWRWWILDGINTPLKKETVELKMPVTLIYSEDDPCITPQMIREEVLPNLPLHTRVIVEKGIGHLYPLETPEWLSEQIESTLNV